MAKISARGCHEVARLNFTEGYKHLGECREHKGILVLRSDRQILRRFIGDSSSGYTLVGRIKPELALDVDVLRRFAQRRNYNVADVAR